MKEIELGHVELMNQDDLPKGFHYPIELRKIMQLGLVNMGVWIIMDKDLAKVRMLELKRRYSRDLVPFAQRIDGDDLACYEVGSNCFTIFKTMSALELRKLRYFLIHGSGYVRQSTI